MSAPGWHSIVTGVDSLKHGVVDNKLYFLRNSNYKSFMWYGRKEHDLKTLFVSDLNMQMTNSMQELGSLDKGPVELNDTDSTEFLESELKISDYDMIFWHLDKVDAEGGNSGFSAEN